MPYHVLIRIDPEGYDQVIVVDKDRGWIEEHIVTPRRQGIAIFINGRELSWESIRYINITETDKTSQEITSAYRQAGYAFNWNYNFNNLLAGEPVDVGGHDVTDEFLTGLPGQALPAENPERLSFVPDRKAVMVIYGHDHEANLALFDWLRSLGLKPQEWSQLIRASGSTSPYVGDVLSQAFKDAQAVIAFFTPDERVQARTASPPSAETWRLQARPNVLIEAGMALVTHPRRTVLVVLGDQELPSDLAGRHYIRLSPLSTEALHALASRLSDAGCDIDQTGEHWLNSARFPDRDNLTQ